MKKHGSFTLNDDNTITGPSDYMNERYEKFKIECEKGTNPSLLSVIYCDTKEKFDADTVFLRALQLDYANWKGVNSLFKGLK